MPVRRLQCEDCRGFPTDFPDVGYGLTGGATARGFPTDFPDAENGLQAGILRAAVVSLQISLM